MGKDKDKTTGNEQAERSIRSMRQALERKRPTRERHVLVLDWEVADEALVAERNYNAAFMAAERMGDNATDEMQAHVAAALERKEAADAALEAAKFIVWFEALGGQEMEDLMMEHLPTKKQQEELRRQLLAQGLPTTERLQYNSDTFPAAIIAACSTDPAIPLDEAKEFWDSKVISRGERAKMLEAAFKVNDIVR